MQRASDLRKGDTFIHNLWAYTIIDVRPGDTRRGTYRFQALSPVGTVVQMEFFDDMTLYVSEGDKK